MPAHAVPDGFDPSSPAACKRVIADALASVGRANRLSARTIGFEDLGGGSMVFVTIHDWHPDPFFDLLRGIARDHGFRVQAR
jgi:hypothetical protein